MSSDVAEARLGNFTLRFGPGGKLQQLMAHGTPLLHEGAHQFPIGPSKKFTVAGWDECFPSIEPMEDCPTMGMLISAQPDLALTPDAALQTWSLPAFTVTRRFQLHSSGDLEILFHAQNISAQSRPFLWASHALFSLENVREISLPGRRLHDLTLDGSTSKSFLANTGPAHITHDSLILSLTTDQPWWGIWLNRGGWPASAPAGFRCIGIEATTTNADRPADTFLQPGQTFHGTITLHAAIR